MGPLLPMTMGPMGPSRALLLSTANSASSLSTSSGSARPLLSPLQSRNLRAAQSAAVPQ